MSNSEPFTNQQFYSLGLKFVLFTLQFFTKINFFKRRKNDFGWSSLNPFSEISFLKSFKCKLANQFYFEEMLLFKNTEMQVWKSPAKCEQIYWWGAVGVVAAAILRRSISDYLQSLSAFVKNYQTSNFWRNFWPAIFQLKHLTSNKCLLERPCIVNSKHLQTST